MRFSCTRPAALLLTLAVASFDAAGQAVGIGTATPNNKAALDISATGKGLLIPRMDSATRAQIASPPDGLMVFQTDFRKGFWYAVGGSWVFIPDKARSGDHLGNHTATQSLNLQGNALTGTGASISGIGVGVRADGGLNLAQNTPGSNFFLGYQAGQSNTYVLTPLGTSYYGDENHFVGYRAGASNTIGLYNQFTGFKAGQANTTGFFNYFSGHRSGYTNDTGYSNTFVGTQTGYSNTSGYGNTFVGTFAGFFNETGSANTLLGWQTYTGSPGLTNATAIGFNAHVDQSNALVLGGTGSDAVNVGIGSSAPTATLDVARGTAFNGTAVLRGTDRHSYFNSGITENTYLRGGKTGSHVLLNDNGGNVGIGNLLPSARLHVTGNVKIDGTNELEFGAGVSGKEANAGKIGYTTFTADALDIVGAGTSGGNRKIKFWNEGGAAFRGAVGIGTDTPQDQLHLHHPSFGRARISAGSGQAGISLLSDNTGEAVLYSPASTDELRAYVGGADRLTISDNGNVGIGTSPARRLHVVDPSAYAYALHAENTYVGNADGRGVYGRSVNAPGFGYGGQFEGGYYGVRGEGTGISYGGTTTGVGGYAAATGTAGTRYGLYGSAAGGALACGIYATATSATTNFAGYFGGNVHVNGTLSKSGGTFRIDHPQDPENKYLVHSFVESPEMLNVYRGRVTTDAQGRAVAELPPYFEAENVRFDYQLTCVGQFAQAIVQEEVRGNRFIIATDKPGVTVCWTVTGARNDQWAQQHPIDPEEPKRPEERGKYLNPELFGQPAAKQLNAPPASRAAAEDAPQGEGVCTDYQFH